MKLKPNRRPIRVTVEGGVIQTIDHIPPGQRVRVLDFDVEGADESSLTIVNRQRDRAIVSEYRGREMKRRPVLRVHGSRLRLTTAGDIVDLRQGIELLKRARTVFAAIGAKRARAAVARALKSADGAARHARRCHFQNRVTAADLQRSIEQTEQQLTKTKTT